MNEQTKRAIRDKAHLLLDKRAFVLDEIVSLKRQLELSMGRFVQINTDLGALFTDLTENDRDFDPAAFISEHMRIPYNSAKPPCYSCGSNDNNGISCNNCGRSDADE